MGKNRHIMMITIGFCLTCAFICFVLGTNLDPWMRLEPSWPFSSRKKLIGLWKVCEITSEKKTICTQQPSTCKFIVNESKKKSCHRLLISRILIIATCVLSGLTALSCFVCGFKKVHQNRYAFLFCQIPLLITLAVSMIGLYFGIYVGSRKYQSYVEPKLDSGAIYFIIGVDVAVFGGLLSMFIY